MAEVAGTTVRFDRTTRAALYARAAIPEYWVVDLPGRQLYVHREPAPEGYRSIAAYGVGEAVSPLERPDAFVRVEDLLPPPAAA